MIKDLIIPYRHLMFHTISLDMAEDSLLRILVMWMCLQFALDCTPRIWKEEGLSVSGRAGGHQSWPLLANGCVGSKARHCGC